MVSELRLMGSDRATQTATRLDAHQSFLGLGSNLQSPLKQVELAIERVAKINGTDLTLQSSFYRSAPMGPQNQAAYVNVVLEINTFLSPLALLGELQAIEDDFGRDRSVGRWGPRIIDLDILLFDNWEIHLKNLKIPHPGLVKRDFVLVPLLEIAPLLCLPDGVALAEMANQMEEYELEKL